MCTVIHKHVCMCMYTCLCTMCPPLPRPRENMVGVNWVFITGGCSRRGVQWMGAVLCNKLVYNFI